MQTQTQQFRLHADSVKEISKATGLLEEFFKRMGPTIRQPQMYPEELEASDSSLLLEKRRLSSPPPYSRYESYGLQVVGMSTERCSFECICDCHRRHHLKSPSALNKFMGQLFVGYTTVVVDRPLCNESSCYRSRVVSAHLFYYFPTWFLKRALMMSITQMAHESIQASISLHKVVPHTAEVFDYCAAGDVSGIHSLFKMGKASANDTYRAGGSPLLTVGGLLSGTPVDRANSSAVCY
jgi:hypothetical protein